MKKKISIKQDHDLDNDALIQQAIQAYYLKYDKSHSGSTANARPIVHPDASLSAVNEKHVIIRDKDKILAFYNIKTKKLIRNNDPFRY